MKLQVNESGVVRTQKGIAGVLMGFNSEDRVVREASRMAYVSLTKTVENTNEHNIVVDVLNHTNKQLISTIVSRTIATEDVGIVTNTISDIKKTTDNLKHDTRGVWVSEQSYAEVGGTEPEDIESVLDLLQTIFDIISGDDDTEDDEDSNEEPTLAQKLGLDNCDKCGKSRLLDEADVVFIYDGVNDKGRHMFNVIKGSDRMRTSGVYAKTLNSILKECNHGNLLVIQKSEECFDIIAANFIIH